MDWLNDLMITFSAVAVNHLGLVAAIERTVKHRLPIVNCPKCLAFWTVLAYGMLTGSDTDILDIAAALLAAWAAIWLELFMGFTDQLYLKAYEQIYTAADSTGADTAGAADAVPGMREDGSGTGEDAGGTHGKGHAPGTSGNRKGNKDGEGVKTGA
jgi:hypothetical protein